MKEFLGPGACEGKFPTAVPNSGPVRTPVHLPIRTPIRQPKTSETQVLTYQPPGGGGWRVVYVFFIIHCFFLDLLVPKTSQNLSEKKCCEQFATVFAPRSPMAIPLVKKIVFERNTIPNQTCFSKSTQKQKNKLWSDVAWIWTSKMEAKSIPNPSKIGSEGVPERGCV